MGHYQEKSAAIVFRRKYTGVTKIGFYWEVLADAEKSRDKGIKSGRYIKTNDKVILRDLKYENCASAGGQDLGLEQAEFEHRVLAK